MNVKKTAKLLLSYYQVIDSDMEAEDYHTKADAVQKVVFESFAGRDKNDDNPLVALFIILHSMNNDIVALDNLGLQSTVEELNDVYKSVDANLRAAVSLLTGENILKSVDPEQNFIDQFKQNAQKVVSLDYYKHHTKKI